jgi:NADPH2:quinone reductase
MPKAIQMTQYGAPEVLQLMEITLPLLQPHEVRLQVVAAAVNRADLEIRSGKWPIQSANPFPYTPGLEAIGQVVEVGEDVTTVNLGDQVITMMQKLGGIHGLRAGGYQEFVTIDADVVAVVPPINLMQVAALGLGAITAYNGLRRMDIVVGQRVVIHGASGGVGSIAVSMAKALGATVIATTSHVTKDEYLLGLGADEIVHLQLGELVKQLGPRSVDAVLETLGELTFNDSVVVLKPGGHLCLVGAASGERLTLSAWDLLQDLHLTGYSSENLTGDDLRADMEELYHWLTVGDIAPPFYQTYPLAEAAQVHHLMESGQLVGRALLVP